MSGRRIGNYQITDYIGSGGFGSVFKAEDVTSPGRVVAIKELHKKHTRNSVIKQRFFQEAVAMARLDHPHLPRLYTFGEDNGSYYLVMEFISGELLSEQIHENGPIDPARAVQVLSQVLEALSYAHRNGIIHRDLKPDNIILTDGGSPSVKVLDFGIARMVGGENLTLTGQGFGTPAYMSPERMSGTASDDPRIDIYSAGIILFEMLAGRTPFQSQASDPVIYWTEMSSLHAREPLPSTGVPGAPAELERILARATAKRSEDRYRSADEMLADLSSVSGNQHRSASAPSIISATPSRIVLTTTPGAADVYVDDTLRGSSDGMRGKLLIEGLAPGLHSVKVTKAGYNDYRINVALEADGQTDLQVALAARATVEMPVAENAAAGSDTAEAQGGDEARTALLVIESLPAGSTLFVGSEAVARADEDGRATVKLSPGSHPVRVTAPTGATASSLVTVRAEEAGSTKTMTLPLLPASTTGAAPAVTAGDQSRTGKRIAAVAVIALLLALVAGAFFVLRGPERGEAQAGASPAAVAQTQAGVTPAPAPDAAPVKQADQQAEAEAKRVAEERQRAQAEAERAIAEKTSAEKAAAEKASAEKANDEKKLAEKKSATTEQIASTAPTPQSPPQPVPAQDACLGVMVTGGPVNRFRLTVVELPEASGAVINGQTNNRGRWFGCGFKAGNRARIVVMGMKGVVRGTREVTLNAGKNLIQIQVGEESGLAPAPPPAPGRRGPRFQRP
jgi:hypothetical protein